MINNKNNAGVLTWHFGHESTIPEGWVACKGQLLEIEEYKELHAVIGNVYGGDAEKTFGLPNFIDARGKGKTIRAATESNPCGSVQDDAMQRVNGYMDSMFFAGGQRGTDWSDEAALYYENAYVVYFLQTVAEGWPNSAAMCRTAIGFDSSRIARTSDETRMTNIAAIPIICTGKKSSVSQAAFDDYVSASVEKYSEIQEKLDVVDSHFDELTETIEADFTNTRDEIKLLNKKIDELCIKVAPYEYAIDQLYERIEKVENFRPRKLSYDEFQALSQEEKESTIFFTV